MNEPVGVLGRLSYSDINKNGLVESNEILSEADYYPFGLQHTENSIATTANKAAEKYQYNAKEFQDELNLNVFDYGARNYDATIGRWFNHDPLSEMAYDLTPYRYGFNNPVSFIDPNGMFESRKEAKDWARENDIRTGLFSSNSITKSDDGTYSVDNRKEGQSFSRADSGIGLSTERADGVVESVFVGVNKSYSQQASDVWNSPIARAAIPDFVSLGGGFSGIAGVGGSTSVEANWVLRGPEASFLPLITSTQSVGGGFSVDITANLGVANYIGSVKDISRKMIETNTFDNRDTPTFWGSLGIAAGGKLGVTGSYTETPKGYGIVGRQLNIGGGLPLGPLPVNGAGGVSNTFILRDFYKKR